MAGAVALALAFGLWRTDPAFRTPPPAPDRMAGFDATASAQPLGGEMRLVYRHSVIPGGVFTPAELGWAIDRDGVVAAHFADVDPSSLHSDILREPYEGHVSYRVGDEVYWTRDALRLAVGERVLTDGTVMIRARCGNRVSLAPMLPVAEAEPPAQEFDGLGTPSVMAALPPPDADPPGTAVDAPQLPGDPPFFSDGPHAATPMTMLVPLVGRPGGGTNGGPNDGRGSRPGSGVGSTPPGFEPPGLNPPAGPEPPGPNPRGPNPPGPNPPGPNPPGPPPPGPGPGPWNPETGTPLPVPEPTTLVLIGLGAGAGLARHLRNRRAQKP